MSNAEQNAIDSLLVSLQKPNVHQGAWESDELLQVLPAALYMTDAAGRITFYNEAAAQLWGCRPTLGTAAFCGSWKLYWPDGTPLPHAECPMALALKERRPIQGMEAVAERPDGTRVPFIPYPTPLFDASGALVGAVNMLVDITERRETEQRLRESEVRYRAIAAIVRSSDDAIVSKDLNSIIKSWNQGAERLFGYSAEEAIGKSVTMLTLPIVRMRSRPFLPGSGAASASSTTKAFVNARMAALSTFR